MSGIIFKSFIHPDSGMSVFACGRLRTHSSASRHRPSTAGSDLKPVPGPGPFRRSSAIKWVFPIPRERIREDGCLPHTARQRHAPPKPLVAGAWIPPDCELVIDGAVRAAIIEKPPPEGSDGQASGAVAKKFTLDSKFFEESQQQIRRSLFA